MSRGYILCMVLLLFFLAPSAAQVQVERTRDKAIIGGVQYFLHSVKKGETIFSISKAYGITTDQLVRNNPGSAGGIKEAQVLRIPVMLVDSAPSAQPQIPQVQRDEAKYIYHVLQPGETIYFLSKKYGTEEEDIFKANPGIDITKLSTGMEIAVPRKEKVIISQETSRPPDSKYYYHKVLNGETLASIAKKYNLTLRSLRKENRDLRFPQVGDYLKIPGIKPVPEKPAEPVVAENVTHENEEKVAEPLKPEGWTPVNNLRGSVNVAVLLPFYLAENEDRIEIDSTQAVKGRKNYNVIARSDDWIYPRSVGFIELYEGILLAADTLRSLGLDINLHTYDITADTAYLTTLIEGGDLNNMDLIIGPVYSKNLAIAAAFARTRGIPVVSPVPLKKNLVLEGNPSLFIANPSLEVAQKYIAEKTRDFAADNILLIRDDSVASEETDNFRNMILGDLGSSISPGETKLKDFVFYSRSAFGADSINRLTRSLSEIGENLVIIDSEDNPVMSESITDIHTLSRKFNLKVIGYPNMRYLDNLDPRICFDLGLMIYSPYWIDYSRENVKQFLKDFMNKFRTQPSEMSYAWQGYDIAYYFLSGLSIHGREFLETPRIHNPELLQTEFDFQRKTSTDGFENQKLFLIRYSNNYQLELIPGAGTIR
jgi:LysM repeat protein